MIPKSGNRFSEKIMLKQNVREAQRFNLNGSCSRTGFSISARNKNINRLIAGKAPNQTQEPLMVLRQEYLSDGGEEGFPWLH
jgi:hypothetical protein